MESLKAMLGVKDDCHAQFERDVSSVRKSMEEEGDHHAQFQKETGSMEGNITVHVVSKLVAASYLLRRLYSAPRWAPNKIL
jgi:hypothetical protein